MEHPDLPSEHQELARLIGNAIAKRYHINRDWFKIHLVEYPKRITIVSGSRVEIICGFSVSEPDFVGILERAIKFAVPRCHTNYSLVTRNSVLELSDLRGKFSIKKGSMDELLKSALPKNRLRYSVKVTREIIGEDISTGNMHTITSSNGNDTEEELVLRLRIEMGKLCGYGRDEE